jgi:two-component system chemotaxis response regulator CheY
MRALVVDDSRTARAIIRQMLREIGLDVIEAAHGLEALEQLRRDPDVELALVDWNMPQMNGLELIQAIRAEPSLRGLRILMVTSETEAVQVSRALSAGADEYLMKPFTKDVLVAKLNLMDVLEE